MRKEKKYHFIYKTTNLLSGRYYIGMHSTDNLDDSYLGSGNRLRLAIRKHGRKNFIREIIEFCETRNELRKRESEIVNLEEVAKKNCMNLAVGGEGGFTDSGGPQAFAKRMKEDIEFRNKILNTLANNTKDAHKSGKIKYDTFKGKNHSEETKEKMRKPKNKGEMNSQYGKCWITNEVENKKIMRGDEIPDGWRLGRNL